MLLHDEENQENKLTIQDYGLMAGGSLPFLIPLELLGHGELGLVLGAAGGVLSFVYGKRVAEYFRTHAPALESASDIKTWLLSKPGDGVESPFKNVDVKQLLTTPLARGKKDTDETPDQDEQTEAPGEEEKPLSPLAKAKQDEIIVLPAVSRLPQAPKFAAMSHLLTDERLILCYDQNGPVYGNLEDLLSLAVVGKPGRGKSTAFLYYVALLARQDCDIWMWDPHASLSELTSIGLQNFHYTDDRADIPASVELLDRELEERRQLYRRTKQVRKPLLLMIDELPVVASFAKKQCPEVFDLLEKFVLEARKWNCYVWMAGQSTDAEILPTRTRDNLSARICFYTSDDRARMAGLETPTIKALMPLLKDERVRGCMIFDCSRLSAPFIGAIPYATVDDVRAFLSSTPLQGDEGAKSLLDEWEELTQNYNASRRFQGRDTDAFTSVQDYGDPTIQEPVKVGLNEPESTVPDTSFAVPTWGPDDRQFTSEQAQEFLTRYRKKPLAVKEILRQMDGGKGLSNRYFKHASWLLKVTGEVK